MVAHPILHHQCVSYLRFRLSNAGNAESILLGHPARSNGGESRGRGGQEGNSGEEFHFQSFCLSMSKLMNAVC